MKTYLETIKNAYDAALTTLEASTENVQLMKAIYIAALEESALKTKKKTK